MTEKETADMGKRIGAMLKQGKLLNPFRLWVLSPLPPTRKRHWKAKLNAAQREVARARYDAVKTARSRSRIQIGPAKKEKPTPTLATL